MPKFFSRTQNCPNSRYLSLFTAIWFACGYIIDFIMLAGATYLLFTSSPHTVQKRSLLATMPISSCRGQISLSDYDRPEAHALCLMTKLLDESQHICGSRNKDINQAWERSERGGPGNHTGAELWLSPGPAGHSSCSKSKTQERRLITTALASV